MVEQRSPKPSVRVQLLHPLPKENETPQGVAVSFYITQSFSKVSRTPIVLLDRRFGAFWTLPSLQILLSKQRISFLGHGNLSSPAFAARTIRYLTEGLLSGHISACHPTMLTGSARLILGSDYIQSIPPRVRRE